MKGLAAAVLMVVSCAASGMTTAELRAHADRIEADYKAAAARCKPLEGNQRDLCNVRAKGERHVARAQLQAQHKPGPRAEEKLALAAAEATHAVAREQCDDLKGNGKDVCRKDAKANFMRARADAKSVRAANDAGQARRDAQAEALYAAGIERCNGLAGQARELCIADLRSRYGKL